MYEKNPNKESPTPDNFVRRVLIVVGTTLSVAILLLILWYVVEVLLLAFAGILLATLLRGLSGLISKRVAISEKWSLAIVCIILVAVMGGGILLLAPDVADQFDQLSQSLAQSLRQLEQELEKHAWGRNVLAMLPKGEEQIFNRTNFLAGVSGIFSTTLSALAGILIILFIGIYVAVEPDLYTGGIVQLVPVRKRARARQVLDEVGYTLRWWLIGQMVSMCVLGTLTGVGLWLLGVPLALTLGLLIGLLTFIPYLGPVIGTIPVMSVALLQSPTMAFYVFLMYLAIQNFEGYLLVPIVQKHAVSLPPALTIMGQVLLGVSLGLPGIVLATPLTAASMVLVKMIYIEDVLHDSSALSGDRSINDQSTKEKRAIPEEVDA